MGLKEKQLEKLKAIFNHRLVTAKHELIVHSQDVGSLPKQVGWLMNNNPDALVRPVTTEEVKALYKFANEEEVPLVPRGAGTSGYGGAIPRKGGIIVDMREMNRVLEINEEEEWVITEPGISWAHLQHHLNRHGLDLRCYPSSGLSATVGGWVAQGGDGIGSLKYGLVNDSVLEFEVVLPNGRIIETKERELFCDTEGILGIITKIRIKAKKLTPIDPIVASFPENYLMNMAIEKIIEEAPLPHTIKFKESKYVDLKKKIWDKDTPFPYPVHHCVVLFAFDGSNEDREAGLRIVRNVVEEYKGTIYDRHVAEHEWEERFYPMKIKKAGPTLVVGQAFAPLENLHAILDDFQFEQASAKAGVDGYVTSKSGVTMMGYFLEDERRRFYMLSWSQSFVIFKIAQRHGGHAHSTGIWFANYAAEYFGKKRLSRIRSAKLKYDPKEISNPGKIFAYWLPFILRIGKYFMWVAFDFLRNGFGRIAPILLKWLQNVPPIKWLLRWGRAHSPWPIQYGLGCCMVDGAAGVASRWDVERFGMLPLFGPRQTDVLWISGSLTKKMAPRLRRIYEQMPEPKFVISFGQCAASGGLFWDGYSLVTPPDKVVPVDVYLPGCPPKPSDFIRAHLILQNKIRAGTTHWQMKNENQDALGIIS
ncbi:MAG: NAD(P)H-quinone oxidoreductase subunit K [Candidatus Thorarchaeota archaeon]|nr:MAG: NAD(P)H-quinone oxidoreductase subunit K [Candidatus Thorarchaeota archaeon]